MRKASARKPWAQVARRATSGAPDSGGNGQGRNRKTAREAGAPKNFGAEIDQLIQEEAWDRARAVIERELQKEPNSHWLLTQLGETYYEQRQYKKALHLLLKSLDIVPDCPLTLWHLAGTLDALGDSSEALRLYAWILKSNRTPQDDPCWESKSWSDALKTDCVFRIAVCFRHLNHKDKAASCFQRYVVLLLAGAEGSYPIEAASRQIRELRRGTPRAVAAELRQAADWIVQASGEDVVPDEPPKLNAKRLRQLREASPGR